MKINIVRLCKPGSNNLKKEDMKKNKSIPILLWGIGLIMIFLISCNKKYDYWGISKFKIDNNALEDNEEINILYSIIAPPNLNKELEYYFHVVAVSHKTGDTVNILTIALPSFSEFNTDKIYNFFNQENSITKSIEMSLNNSTNNNALKTINKVLRDPNFDDIADNNYPTIIGMIGTYESTNN